MNKSRPFLKWAGGKFLLTDKINNLLPEGDCLIEPFVGAGSVFLNTGDKYKRFILNDINPDLINLYNLIKSKPELLIEELLLLFSGQYNFEEAYYELRKEFNESNDTLKRSSLFVYLNRHGYNGLCRYNRSGGFNVPFGRYKKSSLSFDNIKFFADRAQKAKFTCLNYTELFKKAKAGSVIYCDPPYVDISAGSAPSFTAYSQKQFSDTDQQNLAQLAIKSVVKKQVPVLISNHDTPFTREIYKDASFHEYCQVRRYISRDINKRKQVKEVFALFK